MNLRKHSPHYLIIIPIVLTAFTLLLLSGCGDPATPETTATEATADTVNVARAVVPPPPTMRMSLLKSEWQALTDSFQTHFRLKSGAKPITGTEVEILWSEIATKIPAPNGKLRGIVFHYGLDKENFRLGLSFVELTPDSIDYEYPEVTSLRVYPVVGARLGSAISYSSWKGQFLSAPLPATGRYFDAVEVRRTDDPVFTSLSFGNDPQAEMMPYELEVLRLHDENVQTPPQTMTLVVNCAAEVDTILDSYAHKLCLHMRSLDPNSNTVTDLLDDSPRVTGSEFKMHGADLGSLCPPLCKKYVVQQAEVMHAPR
ncbi:MAG: hypothetical protein R2815_14020 [Flavobacteriales bacterium]